MIYLIGGAGNGNFGDELIVRCWLEACGRPGSTRRWSATSNYAGISRRFLGRLHPEAVFVDDVNRLKARGPDTFYAAFARGWRFYENGGFERHPDLADLAARLAQTRLLHLHGGGYVNTIWPRNAFLLGFAAATKRQFGCRLVGTGLGLLPAAAAPELYRPLLAEALAEFDLLEVRDRWGFDWLRRLSDSPRIQLGLDDSFLMRREPPAAPGPRTLHVSWFGFAEGFEAVLDLAAGAGAAGFERVLFWACIDRDMQLFERLAAACRRAEAIHWQDLVARADPGAARRPHGHRALPPAPDRRPLRRDRRLPRRPGLLRRQAGLGRRPRLAVPPDRRSAARRAAGRAATVQRDRAARCRARRGQAPARGLDLRRALRRGAGARRAPGPRPGAGTAGGGALRRAQRLSRTL